MAKSVSRRKPLSAKKGPTSAERPRPRRTPSPVSPKAVRPQRPIGLSILALSSAGVEMLYGRQSVREALRAHKRRLLRLILAEGMERSGTLDDILALAATHRVPTQTVERPQMDGLGDVNHQGVMLETGPFPYAALDDVLPPSHHWPEPPIFLVLDHLQDVGNLGSLLRTAEAVGVQGVLMPKRRAAGVTPAVSHASAGAVEHLPVALVANIVQTIEMLKGEGIWVVGLHPGDGALRYDRADLSGPLALVVGAEGRGLSRLVRERCDFLIALPQWGRVASLNVAVAGAIALYEARRQRQTSS